MLYPYEKNDYTRRTHNEFIQFAQAAEAESVRTGREVIINGVRGVSSLLSILQYPDSVVLDYMHLSCLNHIEVLIKHWQNAFTDTDRTLINDCLRKQQFPHNININFDYSIKEASQWKTKHGRAFILHMKLPILIDILPARFLFHFAVYSIAIKLLHAPENENEIGLAEQLLRFYCQSSSLIYGPTIELYSLHCHLHLSEQVRRHGGLSYSSSFSYESCIRYRLVEKF